MAEWRYGARGDFWGITIRRILTGTIDPVFLSGLLLIRYAGGWSTVKIEKAYIHRPIKSQYQGRNCQETPSKSRSCQSLLPFLYISFRSPIHPSKAEKYLGTLRISFNVSASHSLRKFGGFSLRFWLSPKWGTANRAPTSSVCGRNIRPFLQVLARKKGMKERKLTCLTHRIERRFVSMLGTFIKTLYTNPHSNRYFQRGDQIDHLSKNL